MGLWISRHIMQMHQIWDGFMTAIPSFFVWVSCALVGFHERHFCRSRLRIHVLLRVACVRTGLQSAATPVRVSTARSTVATTNKSTAAQQQPLGARPRLLSPSSVACKGPIEDRHLSRRIILQIRCCLPGRQFRALPSVLTLQEGILQHATR